MSTMFIANVQERVVRYIETTKRIPNVLVISENMKSICTLVATRRGESLYVMDLRVMLDETAPDGTYRCTRVTRRGER